MKRIIIVAGICVMLGYGIKVLEIRGKLFSPIAKECIETETEIEVLSGKQVMGETKCRKWETTFQYD